MANVQFLHLAINLGSIFRHKQHGAIFGGGGKGGGGVLDFEIMGTIAA